MRNLRTGVHLDGFGRGCCVDGKLVCVLFFSCLSYKWSSGSVSHPVLLRLDSVRIRVWVRGPIHRCFKHGSVEFLVTWLMCKVNVNKKTANATLRAGV